MDGTLVDFLKDTIMIWLIISACSTQEEPQQIKKEKEVTNVLPPCEGEGILIPTNSGCILGLEYDGTELFLGIPYAEPPIGDLRWKRTVPVKPWADVFYANATSAACTQLTENGEIWGEEDCLTLNVFRPKDRDPSEPLPILFFTHGGSFKNGVGSFDVFEYMPTLAKEAILVTYNYRLGPFGFLAHQAFTEEDESIHGGNGSSGNFGIFDSNTALQWVYDNAEHFDGDPNQIMIFGESAGGVTTCIQLTTPQTEGIFSSALIQSGNCTYINTPLEEAQNFGADFSSALGCEGSNEEIANCLREKSPSEIVNLDLTAFANDRGFYPNIDNVLLTDEVGVLLYTGNFHKVPIISGVNANEGSMFVHQMGISSQEELENTLEEWSVYFGVSDLETLTTLYHKDVHGSPQAAFDQFYGDVVFVCPIKHSLGMFSHYTPAYGYYYSHVPSWNEYFPELEGWGAYHGSELNFVFGTNLEYLTSEEQQMSEKIRDIWISHAKGLDMTDYLGWDKFQEVNYTQFEEEHWLEIQTGEFEVISDVHNERCNFFFEQWFGNQ